MLRENSLLFSILIKNRTTFGNLFPFQRLNHIKMAVNDEFLLFKYFLGGNSNSKLKGLLFTKTKIPKKN